MKMIELENITKEYGNRTILSGLTGTFYPGRLYAVTGRSGAGKSTFLNIIGLLDHRFSGSLRFFGRETSAMGDRERSRIIGRKIGFLFQYFNLIEELSMAENIMLPWFYGGRRDEQEARGRLRELCEKLELGDLLQRKAGSLSGGEQQRAALARALLMEPAVILADEPTGSLDRRNAETVMGCLKAQAAEDRLVIVVTHDASVLRYADEIRDLRDGCLP